MDIWDPLGHFYSLSMFENFPKHKKWFRGFPVGTVVKNLPATAGDMGSSPGLGRSLMPWSN